MAELLTTDSLVAFLMLTVMEIVLGIDNIVFVAILAGKLPEDQRDRARKLGLSLALLMRIGLLCGISWIMTLQNDLFQIRGHGFSGRDLILLLGGLFLIAKATHEIHHKLEGEGEAQHKGGRASFGLILAQILILDVVFSLDSVITAVGMAQKLPIMIAAVIVAVLVMLIFSKPISAVILRHPSLKILALAFLLLIGVMLVADGMGQHVSKGYIYSAMAFSVFVELLNLRYRAKQKPVVLRQPYGEAP